MFQGHLLHRYLYLDIIVCAHLSAIINGLFQSVWESKFVSIFQFQDFQVICVSNYYLLVVYQFKSTYLYSFCFLVIYLLGKLYCLLFRYRPPTVDYFTDFESVLQSWGSEYTALLMEATAINDIVAFLTQIHNIIYILKLGDLHKLDQYKSIR